MISTLFLNSLFFNITAILALFFVPLGVWDHLIPHSDIEAEYHHHLEREQEKEAARIFKEHKDELSKQEMEREMDDWRKENGYLKWDEKHRRYVHSNDGGTVESSYSGTCGPPDRDH